jgi:hypothetical protein
MKIELGFQPNCSETVFRFSRKEVGNLSPEVLKAFWLAAANGCTKERLAENAFAGLALPSLKPVGGEYSSLQCQDADHFVLAYYQMTNDELLEFAKEHMKDWIIDAPFTPDNERIPKEHDHEYVEEKTISSIFRGNSLPPKGFEDIMELKKEFAGVVTKKVADNEKKEG